ncbi:hypothetical protein ECG_04914 [Echinococcus granulosus]|uniref:RhoGAP n=1 Tax=Echinococcus granulosus TaxID=6210 RepID=A0A068W9S4_ECHGR|nr:hypothetical protein ECG_04914 [Echinococcus granulosus]CDS16743.1 RhoGAP [Echinococcus granulosus]
MTSRGICFGSERPFRDTSPPDEELQHQRPPRKRRASPIPWPWRRKSPEEKIKLSSNLRYQSRSLSDILGQISEIEAQRIKNSVVSSTTNLPSSPPLFESSTMPIIKKPLKPPMPQNHIHNLDEELVEPDHALRDLRLRYPRTFTNLIASYLTFIEIHSDDLFRIAEEVGKQEAQMMGRRKGGTFTASPRCSPGSPISRSVFTPVKMNSFLATWSASKVSREEMTHWYKVVNVMINHLLEGKKYCCNFIFRRPGVQRQVNNLEKQLFCQKLFRSCEDDPPLTGSVPPSIVLIENWRISRLLASYNSITVASTLCRILRRHGPLIPSRLHYLFSQLSSPQDCEFDIGLPARQFETGSPGYINRCRALRLLLQLTPSRHLSLIYRPLSHLLALITMEPICEVNEDSICVLFAPIFLMDREASNPAELANPQLQQVVRLLLEIAKSEMPFVGQTQTSCFRVPRLFLNDCRSNLMAHKRDDDPPLQCSLRYCTRRLPRVPSVTSLQKPLMGTLPISGTTTPVQQTRRGYQRKLFASAKNTPSSAPLSSAPLTDATNIAGTQTTPVVLKPLHSMSFKFRVRRMSLERGPLKAVQPRILTPVNHSKDLKP